MYKTNLQQLEDGTSQTPDMLTQSTRPQSTAHIFDRLPEDIWLKIVDCFAPQMKGGIGFCPPFELPNWQEAVDRRTLCSLSMTCKALTNMSQATLFRLPLPVRAQLYFKSYEQVGQEMLYRAILCARPSLQAAVHAIALDVSLEVDYYALIDTLPNLTHLELYVAASSGPRRHDRLSESILKHDKLTHIKLSIPCNGGPAPNLPIAYVPSGFRGHLFIDGLGLHYSSEEKAPLYACYPNFCPLTLRGSHFRDDGLAYLIGTSSGQTLTSFAVTAFYAYVENLDPLFSAYSDNLQELVCMGEILGGNLPIERFRNLRKLALPGSMFSNEGRSAEVEEDAEGSELESEAGTSSRNLAYRLPETLEQLHIERPCVDCFEVARNVILPRLPRLHRLHTGLGVSFGPRNELMNALRDEMEILELPATQHGRLRLALAQATRLDEACSSRGIATQPTSFRQGLEDKMAELDRYPH